MSGPQASQRIDTLLFRLRLSPSRARAQALVRAGHIRCNGVRVVRAGRAIGEGDTLTLPTRAGPLVIAVDRLPLRRGPPAEARACYRVLDPAAPADLGENETRRERNEPEP